jgi:photosystem II cytochrome c550
MILQRLRRLLSGFGLCLLIGIGIVSQASVAQAEALDAYVLRYLDAKEPIELAVDQAENTRLFSPTQLSEGKRLFEENCTNCHVGGATLPDPTLSLALTALQGATPPRDTINALVDFMRQPKTYDGSEETFWCRQVPDSWLPQEQIENLAAFVLRAAQKAPGWGTSSF